MKHYGIEIPEGTEITNITVPSGPTFPDLPNIGELFYLTTGNAGLYTHTGTDWVSAGGASEGVPTSVVTDTLVGNGVQTDFTLSQSPGNENEILVFVTGVRQEVSAYSVTGTTLTFTEAPPNAASIEVVHLPMSITGKTLEQTPFTATEGQTTFTVDYNVGYVLVFLNGVRLVSGTDFTATNGTSIVLTVGATADDILEVISFGVFAVADHYTKTESDTTFAPITRSRKNYIINGNFDIWQRATSQTSSGYGSVDRWSNDHNGTNKTASRQPFTLGQTDVPNNPKYYSRTAVTSSAGAGNYCIKYQKIEDVTKLSGKTATLSFWAKADAAKNIAVDFGQSFGNGGSPSSQVNAIGVTTVALTTVWQKFTIAVTFPSVSGKTLGTDNNDSTFVMFWFDAGSIYDARTNSLGQQSGTFDIAQVQLEEGNVATDFEYRPIGEELALCQRYYQTISEAGAATLIWRGNVTSGLSYSLAVPLPTPMRATPTFVVKDPVMSGFNTPTVTGSTSSCARIDGSAATTADSRWFYFWLTADAEL